jgi:poly(beta-D-mannuronate) C5 epimerase
MHDRHRDTRRTSRATGKGRWLATAVALLLSGPILAEGVPNQDSLDLQARLSTLEQFARDPSRDLISVPALIDAAGLGPRISAVSTGAAALVDRPPSAHTPTIGQMQVRLALTPLVQAYGAIGNTAVLVAQTDPALLATVIESGDVSIAALRDHLGAGPGPLRLTRPLVIMAGAALVLGQGETLELSRADGAFIINFGHLQLHGGTIAATSEESPSARSFRPFVTTVNTGTVDLRGATLRDLGFGSSPKFAGFSILRSVLQGPDRSSRIEGARFERLGSVAITGETGILIRANRFVDMQNAALTLQRTTGAQVLYNLFWGDMRTNAIRLEAGSEDGLIAGNVILGGDRAGIVVRGETRDAILAGNIVWDRDGGGIALSDADCSIVHDNLVIANDQKGIEVRASDSVRLHRNIVLSNHSAGLWVSAQDTTAHVLLSENRVAYNGAGLAGANTANILMAGNDFSRQYQQFLSGDLALLTPVVARDMHGSQPFILGTGAPFDLASPLPPCEG